MEEYIQNGDGTLSSEIFKIENYPGYEVLLKDDEGVTYYKQDGSMIFTKFVGKSNAAGGEVEKAIPKQQSIEERISAEFARQAREARLTREREEEKARLEYERRKQETTRKNARTRNSIMAIAIVFGIVILSSIVIIAMHKRSDNKTNGETYSSEQLMSAEAADEETYTILGSGSCGTNTYWEFNDYGVLTISGTGSIDECEGSEYPWYKYADYIYNVVIEDGVVGTLPTDAFGLFYDTLETISIPGTITTIASQAVWGSSSLYSVTIGEGVVIIEKSAFSLDEGLEFIYLPDTIKQIGESAFHGCTSLSYIYVGEGLELIGAYAFSDCTALTSISLPASMKVFDTDMLTRVFDDDTLTDIYYAGTEEQWNQIAFSESIDDMTMWLTAGHADDTSITVHYQNYEITDGSEGRAISTDGQAYCMQNLYEENGCWYVDVSVASDSDGTSNWTWDSALTQYQVDENACFYDEYGIKFTVNGLAQERESYGATYIIEFELDNDIVKNGSIVWWGYFDGY